jgi:hypothetical protein
VKTDVGQVDLVLRLSDGTSEKKSEILKRAGTTDKSISTGIKYWVCWRISDFFSLVPSDNRNTRSTCPTSVFTGIGQTLMSRPEK